MTTYGSKMGEADVNDLILEAKYDSDGYINYEEFVKFLMSH